MRIGVVVGRFQIHDLHSGHVALLDKARQNSDHLVVFLGVSALAGTKRNPLDYATRHVMICSHMLSKCPTFPFSVEPIKDVEDDAQWSSMLDERIKQHVKYGDSVTLYGGDDSFLSCYTGEFVASQVRLSTHINQRATQLRAGVICQPAPPSVEFRQGVIYAIGNMRDTVSCTVDIACINREDNEVLVGRKAEEKRWRFPGGFVDSTDKNLITAARREFSEETGLSIEGQLHYVGSQLVDDWRFRNSPDKAVMTTLFACAYNFGKAKAGDDLAEVQWIPLHGGQQEMNHGHSALFSLLTEWFKDNHNVL